MEYLADLPRNKDGTLQIMYGIGGERNLRETTLRHLKGYDGSRPVRKGNGAYNQRQNDVYGAVLDSVYLHTKRHDHVHDRLWPVLVRPGGGRLAGVAQARPGHLGGARRAAALRLLEADVLGRARSRRAARRAARGARARGALAGRRRRDPRRHPRPRSRRPRRVRPALRHHRARRLQPAGPDRPLPAARRRARARDGAGDRRRAQRPRAGAALPRRADRRRPQRGGGHVPDLLVLDGLGAVGDRRAPNARARCASGCCRSPRRSGSTPRSSTPAAAATSATSPRPSPISR